MRIGLPALPQIALVTASARGLDTLAISFAGGFLALAVVGLTLFLVGLFHVFMVTQAKGAARSTAAVVLFALCSHAVFRLA